MGNVSWTHGKREHGTTQNDGNINTERITYTGKQKMSMTKQHLMDLVEQNKVCAMCFDSEHTTEEHAEYSESMMYAEQI